MKLLGGLFYLTGLPINRTISSVAAESCLKENKFS